MERSQAINQLNLITITCQNCQTQCPTYRIVRVQKQKAYPLCLNCLKKNKIEMANVSETYYETALKWIDNFPTPDYSQATYCLKLIKQIEAETMKSVEMMKNKLKQMEWEVIQTCKKTKNYCQSYLQKVKYFQSFSFEESLHTMAFDQKKVINQENELLNIRKKIQSLQQLKSQLKVLQLKVPTISDFSKNKKEQRKLFVSDIPITAMINAKGKNYYGTADGRILYEGYEKLQSHKGHDSLIRSFSFDGQYTIYSGSDDFRIKAWDIHDNQLKEIQSFGKLEQNKSYHRNIAVLNRGDLLVSTRGQFDNFRLRIWDLKNQYRNIGSLEGHQNFIRGMAIIKENQIATISDDKTIKIWNIKSSQPVKSIQLKAKISQIVINHSRKLMAIVDDDNKITLFDLDTLDIINGWIMPRKVLCSVGSDGHIILATHTQISIWLWSCEKIHTFELQTQFSPALMNIVNKKLIVASGMGVVHEYPMP